MDRSIKNTAWLAAVTLAEGLQLMILMALIGSFIPIAVDATYYNTLFPFDRKGLVFKRDLFYYRFWVLFCIGLQALLLYVNRQSLNDASLPRKLRAWLVMALALFLPQFYLIYQFWLGPHPEQSRQWLCIFCALAVLVRIFWPEVYRLFPSITPFFKFPDLRSWMAVCRTYRDSIKVFLITVALTVQAYLYMFLLYGWYAHTSVWPSADAWNYLVLAAICLVTGTIVTVSSASRVNGFRTAVEGLLAFLLLNALFKLHVYFYQPLLAQHAYIVLLIISVIVKLAWPWLDNLLRTVWRMLTDPSNAPALKVSASTAFILFIILFFYVPDMEAAMARVFMGEQFHTIDVTLMNTGWAYHTGCRLNVDINNRYGLGMAVMVAWLSNLLGGFNYQHIFILVMLACTAYFLAAFVLLRWWLGSVPIAMAGVLIAMKMQPFHDETSSFYLTNPTTTVCRFFFDMPFFFFVLLFLRSLKRNALLVAGGISALAIFYSLDTGIYLTCAYYAFLMLILGLKETREAVYRGWQDNGFAAALLLLPPVGALGLLRLTQGPSVFTSLFWQNMTEYIHFQLWYGPVHLKEALKAHDPWIFSLSMGVIAVYMLTMLTIGSLVYLKKAKREALFTVAMCVYGFAFLNYYVNRPCLGSMYEQIIPYVFILCFWIREIMERLSGQMRLKALMVLLLVCFYALWTTHLTLAYPNVFNLSRNPAVDPMVAPRLVQGKLGYFNQLFIQYPDAFKLPLNSLGESFEDWRTEDDFKTDDALKQYFRKAFDFSKDAALIDGLTKPDEPVAVFSSFEIKILIDAGRKPFFYVFPLVDSQPMFMRKFEVTHMWRTTDLERTIRQLQDAKPPFVFMERIYLAPEIPAAYLYDMPGACALADYIRQNYEPYKIGQYLVAMKRKGAVVEIP